MKMTSTSTHMSAMIRSIRRIQLGNGRGSMTPSPSVPERWWDLLLKASKTLLPGISRAQANTPLLPLEVH